MWSLFLFALLLQQEPARDVQKRVSPNAYTSAPAAIRAELTRRHCQLPSTQHWDETRLNLVRGHFGDATQSDWAAICIQPDGSTYALVHWSKTAYCPAEIRWSISGHLPPGKAGSLYLLAAPVRQILAYRKFFGDAHSNPVTHDGVEVGDEQASTIYYCYRGRWLELQGND